MCKQEHGRKLLLLHSKKHRKYLLYSEESVTFAKENLVKGKIKRSYRFDRDTHQIIQKTEKTSSINGGPHKLLRN